MSIKKKVKSGLPIFMKITIDGFSIYTTGTFQLDQIKEVIRHKDITILQSTLYFRGTAVE